jgi:flagellar motor switch protein FliN/FliY
MMAKSKRFDDPLESVDPIMQSAFSVSDDDMETVSAPKKRRAPARKQAPAYSDFDDYAHDTSVSGVQFPNLDETVAGRKFELDVFKNIPVNLSVELGRSQITLKEVYELTEGAIIELERFVGEPLDLVVNGQIIAQGEVVAIDNNYGLRVTQIVSQTDSAS